MTGPELLRASGWRQGHSKGRVYWEHDLLPGVQHDHECALTQALDWHRAKLKAICEATESVRGVYKHPDELESAVFKAFDRIAELARAEAP